MNSNLKTTAEVAETLGVCGRTLTRLIERGCLSDVGRFDHSTARAWRPSDVDDARQALLQFNKEHSRLFRSAVELIDSEAILRTGVLPSAENLLSGRALLIDLETLCEVLNLPKSYLRDYLKKDGSKPRLRPSCRQGHKLMFSIGDVVEWLRAVKARKFAESIVTGESQ